MNNEAGQIDGSVSITPNGEVYIVSEVEDVRVVLSLEPLPSLDKFLINIEQCTATELEGRGCTVNGKEDAMEALCSLGVVLGLSELSLKAILGIIDEEWRTPQQVADFVSAKLEGAKASKDNQEYIARMIENN